MDINDAYPKGEYISAADLKPTGPLKISIAGFEIKNFGEDGDKPVISFVGTDKKLVLNKTNGSVIADIHGSETNNWVGKQITLYPTKTDFGGKLVDCIRIQHPEMAMPTYQAPLPAQQPPGNGGDAAPPVPGSSELNDEIPF